MSYARSLRSKHQDGIRCAKALLGREGESLWKMKEAVGADRENFQIMIDGKSDI